MPSARSVIWKSLVFFGALVFGFIAAAQAGWSGAETIQKRGQAGFVTDTLLFVSLAGIYFAITLVLRHAKYALYMLIPIFLYVAGVSGWNAFMSDFDYGRGRAIRAHYANGYILEHMSDRGRFLSCQDSRIDLTEDAKSVCARALNLHPGLPIPGSEHRCGFLGFFECVEFAPDIAKTK